MRFVTRTHRYAARRLCRLTIRPGDDVNSELPARFAALAESETMRPRLLGLFAGNWHAYLQARKQARNV
jgi:hypothetical protein